MTTKGLTTMGRWKRQDEFLTFMNKRVNLMLFILGASFLIGAFAVISDYQLAYALLLHPLQLVRIFSSTTAQKPIFLAFLLGASLLINSFVRKKTRWEATNFLIVLTVIVLAISFLYAPWKVDRLIEWVETKNFGIDQNYPDRPTLKYNCYIFSSWKENRELTLTTEPMTVVSRSHIHLLRSGLHILNSLVGFGIQGSVVDFPINDLGSQLYDVAIVFGLSVILLGAFILNYSLETGGSTGERLYRITLLTFITYLLGDAIFEAEEVMLLPLLAVLVGLFFFEEFDVFRRFKIYREIYLTVFFVVFWVADFLIQNTHKFYLLGAIFLYALFGITRASRWKWRAEHKKAVIGLYLVIIALTLLREYVLLKFVVIFVFLFLAAIAMFSENLKKWERVIAIFYLLFFLSVSQAILSEKIDKTNIMEKGYVLIGNTYRSFQTPLANYTLLFFDKAPDVGGFEIYRGQNLVIMASNQTCKNCFWFKNKFDTSAPPSGYRLILKDVGADLSLCGIENTVKYKGWMEIPVRKVDEFQFGCVMAMQARISKDDTVSIGCMEK